MYANGILCQGVLGHARDYMACQHMLEESYAILWHDNIFGRPTHGKMF